MGTFLAIVACAIPMAIIFAVVSSADKKAKEEKRIDIALLAKEQRQVQIDFIKEKMQSHLRTLAVKRMQMVQVNDYGIVHDELWKKEFVYFWNNVVKTLPGKVAHLNTDEMMEVFDSEVISSKFFSDASTIQQSLQSADPYQYEHLCAKLTTKDGWRSRATSGSGDQGVDVICEKDGAMVVIQCKKYTGNVGNKAVQEIHAGKSFYKADHAVVITNSGYTTSAKTLANSLGVKLLKESHLTDLSAHL